MSRFDDAFERTVGHEGGYVNDPRDPGGETIYGISRRSHPQAWALGRPTLDQAKTIYRDSYWTPLRCDELPVPLDEFLFDYAVNSGVGKAAMALQAAVGALQDGKVGPRTIAAVKAKEPREVLRLLFVDRAMTFAMSPNDKTFGRGWFARLFDKTWQAFKEAA